MVTNSQMGASHRNACDRVGIHILAKDTPDALRKVREAEAAGVHQVWTTAGGAGGVDALTFYAAAALQTDNIRLGTSIVPIFPRHPAVTALQTLAIHDLAPGRFRLGIGPSTHQIIEGQYGLRMPAPLAYLKEYATVLRSALWDGKVDFHGRFFNVAFTLPRRAQVPLLVSALGQKAFRLAGEISDGAISWMCPVPYLLDKALPALRAGAKASHRPTPPVVAHVPVAMTIDETAARAAILGRLRYFTGNPFYAQMFAAAGLPVAADGSGLDALARGLIVAGDGVKMRQQLVDLLADGLDELLVGLFPVADEEDEWRRLLQVIGSL